MHIKAWLRRWLPHHHYFRDHPHLKPLGDLLLNPEIWHLTRRSTAGAVAIGLFIAFIMPLPIQMLLAAVLAIALRINLPIAVVCTFASNPFTTPPVVFLAYELGALLLDAPPIDLHFEPTWRWVSETLIDIWEPFAVGISILSTLFAVAGYVAVRVLWRLHLVRRWRARRQRRRTAAPE
jgi:uncharacterized protein (DUF2062 family)